MVRSPVTIIASPELRAIRVDFDPRLGNIVFTQMQRSGLHPKFSAEWEGSIDHGESATSCADLLVIIDTGI